MQETVLSFPGLSRRELAHTICEQLHWHTAKGGNRIQAALRMLEELERLDVLSLPATDLSRVRGARKPVVWGSRTDAPPVIQEDLEALLPIRLQVVSDAEGIEEWNEYVARYHYMGFRHPIGPRLRYFLLDRDGRKLGCLLFSHGSRQLQCRDAWIGWPEGYRKHLDRVVGNNRFLLFPWVRVRNLASKALSIATGRLADDWEERHGYRPVLVESFVDTSRFHGSCYRAANWLDLGETRGGKGKAPKRVYVYPLAEDFREVLLHGPPRSAPRRSPRPVTTTQLTQRSLARFAEHSGPSHLLECGSGLHEVCHSSPEFRGTGHGLSFGWDEADISSEIDGEGSEVGVRQANSGVDSRCKSGGKEGVTSHFCREPCVGSREGMGEASVAVRVGRANERRNT